MICVIMSFFIMIIFVATVSLYRTETHYSLTFMSGKE